MNIEYFEKPYQIWIIDSFLEPEILNVIDSKWPSINSGNWHSGYEKIKGEKNILENGMLAISDFSLLNTDLRKILENFHTNDFNHKIKSLLDIKDNLIPDHTFRWSGLRMMKPNSFQLIHSDARKHPQSLLRKELTCLLYLNENWKKEDEGCLEIWDDQMNKAMEIQPLFNRLVVFRNSNTSFHGVPKVKRLRKMITWSILSDLKPSSRTKSMFVARPKIDSKKITTLGIARSKVLDRN